MKLARLDVLLRWRRHFYHFLGIVADRALARINDHGVSQRFLQIQWSMKFKNILKRLLDNAQLSFFPRDDSDFLDGHILCVVVALDESLDPVQHHAGGDVLDADVLAIEHQRQGYRF